MVPSGTKEWPGRTWRLVLADTSHVRRLNAPIQALFQRSHHPYDYFTRSCRCSRPNPDPKPRTHRLLAPDAFPTNQHPQSALSRPLVVTSNPLEVGRQSKHYGLVPVNENPPFEMQTKAPCQCLSFAHPPFLRKSTACPYGRSDDFLLNNRTRIQFCSHVVTRRANQLHATLIGLIVGRAPTKLGKKL